MPDKYAIRTTDRALFKQCRVKWDMNSPLRLGYQPDKPATHFVMGSAIHAAMESWYAPGAEFGAYQSDARAKWAKETFIVYIKNQYRELVQRGFDNRETDKEYDELLALGPKMLDYYFGWAKIHDDFEPVTVEHEFEVQIGCKCGDNLYFGDDTVARGCRDGIYRDKCTPIVYQGRIDGLVRDYRGYYFVLEFKTAAKEDSPKWLQTNDQVSSYEWALQEKLGIPIKGTIYTILFKRAPERPKILKDGSVSCDMRQNTTASLFVEAVEEAHPFRPAYETIVENEKYQRYHEFLTNPELAPKFVERPPPLRRNPAQLVDVGRRIALEAKNMLNDPDIYPTITSFNCNKCAFWSPCLTRQEGGDWMHHLASEYGKRT